MKISYKKVKPTPLELARSLNREIVSNFTKYLERAKNLNKQVFDGVIVSYPRPFHVFYDMLPTVHYDLTSKSRLNIPNIYSTTNGAFLSIKKLYDLPCNEVFIEADNLNEVLLQNRKFILQIAKAKSSSYNHFHDLDHLLIKKSKERLFREEHEKRVFNKAKECYPLLWFGICGEKRSWVEQGEGISLIIQEVQKLYPNVGVVLDGLTSTIAQNEQQFRRRKAKKDIEIAKQIKSKIDPSIPFFNLIGSNSVKKITYASQIDFFLTGMGTDSMYVARICRKHGIGHINNTLNTTNHKHPYTLKIQNDYVKDVLKKKRNRKGSYLSYSIDPKIVSSLFLENLQKYLKNKS